MTKEQYQKITDRTRTLLHGRVWLLQVPTVLCAGIYGFLFLLQFSKGTFPLRYCLFPLTCFVLVSLLRTLINRTRPYDFFHLPPVGSYLPGKGKSMPSRHAASATAIALAVLSVVPNPAFRIFCILLCLLICSLRVFSGFHYPSDVIAGMLLSAGIFLLFMIR